MKNSVIFFWYFCFGFLFFSSLSGHSQEKKFINNFNFQAKPVITSEYLKKENLKVLSPEDYNGIFERGFLRLNDGLVNEAMEDFESVIYGAPEFGGGYYGVGLCHKINMDTARASEFFVLAVKKDPFFGPAHLESGDLRILTNINEAQKSYQLAQKLMPQSAEPVYRLGLIEMIKNRPNKAKRIFKKGLKIEPLHTGSHLMLGRIYLMEQKFNLAAKSFTRCINADKDQVEAYVWRAVSKIVKSKFNPALKDLNVAVDLQPQNMVLYTLRGALKYHKKLYLEAANDFSQTFFLSESKNSDFNYGEGLYPRTEEFKFLFKLVTDPNNFKDSKSQTAMAKVVSSLFIEDYATAERTIKPYLKTAGNLENFVNGIILEKRKKKISALEWYKKCEAGSPVYSEAIKKIGFITYEVLKDYPLAYSMFDQLTGLDSTYTMGYKYKGIIHLMDEKYNEAIAEFSTAIEYDSTGSDLYYNRASCLLRQNRFEESIEDYKRVVQLKPKDAEVWKLMGDIQLSLGKNTEARESYSQSLQFKYNSVVYFERGIILFQEKDYKNALLDFKKVEDYSPNYENALLNISNCLYFLEEYDQAINQLDILIGRNSSEPKAYFLRGLCYLKLQNQLKAKDNFRFAKDLGMDGVEEYLHN